MKTIFALALLISANAFALGRPLLSYVGTSGGGTAPQYHITTNCDVYPEAVVKVVNGGIVGVSNKSKPVAWTSVIPNEQTLAALIVKAQAGKIDSRPGAIGGFTTTYVGHINTFETVNDVTLQKSGGIVVEKNKSREAKELVKFIDYNCK